MAHPAPTPTHSPVPYRADWRHSALCRDEDPEIFFGEAGPASTAAARAVCARCPVRRPCLTEGIREPHGVRAGLTEDEREAMGRAYGVYLRTVTETDAMVREASAQLPVGLVRAASAALSVEGDAVASVALALAEGAPAREIQEAAELALAAETSTDETLSELGLAPPARARARGQELLDAAIVIATTPVTDPTESSSVPVFGAVA